MLGSDKLINVNNKKRKKDKRKCRSLATVLFSISDPLNIITAFFLFTYALGVQCICAPPCDCVLSPYQCPLKPSFPVGGWRNWIKDIARGLLGPGLRPAGAQRPSLDISPSIKNQTDSRTYSIPAVEKHNVPTAEADAFYFSSRNMRGAAEPRVRLR